MTLSKKTNDSLIILSEKAVKLLNEFNKDIIELTDTGPEIYQDSIDRVAKETFVELCGYDLDKPDDMPSIDERIDGIFSSEDRSQGHLSHGDEIFRKYKFIIDKALLTKKIKETQGASITIDNEKIEKELEDDLLKIIKDMENVALKRYSKPPHDNIEIYQKATMPSIEKLINVVINTVNLLLENNCEVTEINLSKEPGNPICADGWIAQISKCIPEIFTMKNNAPTRFTVPSTHILAISPNNEHIHIYINDNAYNYTINNDLLKLQKKIPDSHFDIAIDRENLVNYKQLKAYLSKLVANNEKETDDQNNLSR